MSGALLCKKCGGPLPVEASAVACCEARAGEVTDDDLHAAGVTGGGFFGKLRSIFSK